jgi:hypothetical protein
VTPQQQAEIDIDYLVQEHGAADVVFWVFVALQRQADGGRAEIVESCYTDLVRLAHKTMREKREKEKREVASS